MRPRKTPEGPLRAGSAARFTGSMREPSPPYVSIMEHKAIAPLDPPIPARPMSRPSPLTRTAGSYDDRAPGEPAANHIGALFALPDAAKDQETMAGIKAHDRAFASIYDHIGQYDSKTPDPLNTWGDLLTPRETLETLGGS